MGAGSRHGGRRCGAPALWMPPLLPVQRERCLREVLGSNRVATGSRKSLEVFDEARRTSRGVRYSMQGRLLRLPCYHAMTPAMASGFLIRRHSDGRPPRWGMATRSSLARRLPAAKAAALPSTCHGGAVRLVLPSRPRVLISRNCSIGRRYGTLWAYFKGGPGPRRARARGNAHRSGGGRRPRRGPGGFT